MIGNAVLVRMENILANKILSDLSAIKTVKIPKVKRWKIVSSMIDNSVISA
ncbi:MAG: hypothetical protein QM530_05170 [Phycisphaerales bacterium]|nr:hypothetical protein [Phycisphaerales bacterium]